MIENTTVIYPQDPAVWGDCPIMPSPASWFRWHQRYIFNVTVNGEPAGQQFMNGYGGFYEDYTDSKTGRVYGANAFLSSLEPETISSMTYVRLEDTEVDFVADKVGLAWIGKGLGTMLFDTEMLIYDNPLVLGKTWTSQTTVTNEKGVLPIHFEAKVGAFIPHDIKSLDDIVVAPGHSYKPAIAIEDIPKPLEELGNKSFAQMEAVPEAEALIDWDEVKIPDGPRAGEVVKGYYVLETRTQINGITVLHQDLWKDARGYSPIYDIRMFPPLVEAPIHLIRKAHRWTGTLGLEK